MALEEFLQNQENESQPIVSLPRTFKRAVLYYSALCVTSPVLVLPGRVCASRSGTHSEEVRFCPHHDFKEGQQGLRCHEEVSGTCQRWLLPRSRAMLPAGLRVSPGRGSAAAVLGPAWTPRGCKSPSSSKGALPGMYQLPAPTHHLLMSSDRGHPAGSKALGALIRC